jgi:hypothetical protein
VRNSKLPQKVFSIFFSRIWIEHIELPRMKWHFHFQKQTFQENFQKILIFIFHYRRLVILHTYVNILLFFRSVPLRKYYSLICHTKLNGQNNNCTVIFFPFNFLWQIRKNIYDDVQTKKKVKYSRRYAKLLTFCNEIWKSRFFENFLEKSAFENWRVTFSLVKLTCSIQICEKNWKKNFGSFELHTPYI